jgi:RES domain-containing protein
MTVYRIGDPAGEFPVWHPGGAMRHPGRWNVTGSAVIYAARAYSLAMLEKLAHWNGVMPPHQHFVAAVVPAGISYELFQPAAHVGWNAGVQMVAKRFGSMWLREARSAVLIVPSVIAPMEDNLLVNPMHPDAARIVPGMEQPVWWDARLLRA